MQRKDLSHWFLKRVIRPVIHRLYPMAKAMGRAEILLLGTVAHESGGFDFLRQYPHGPALGVWNIEPPSHRLALGWAEENDRGLYLELVSMRNRGPAILAEDIDIDAALQLDMEYGCAIARTLYLSIPSPLPSRDHALAQAIYWKSYYNRGGKGTEGQYIEAWERFVEPVLHL